MADIATCSKCGRPYDASKATCPHCGHTRWEIIIPGVIFGLICVGVFFFVAPGISSDIFRAVVKWATGILGSLTLLGELPMIVEALSYKKKPVQGSIQDSSQESIVQHGPAHSQENTWTDSGSNIEELAIKIGIEKAPEPMLREKPTGKDLDVRMDSTKEKELIIRLRQHLLENGFTEHADSPYVMLLYRDSSEFPDVKQTYFILTKLEGDVSAQDMRTQIKTAQDHLSAVFKLKGFLKSFTATYVLYFIVLMDKVSQQLIDLFQKNDVSNVFQRIVPVWIEQSTNEWFIARQSYVDVPYDIYKFHVQEIVNRLGAILYPDFLMLPNVQQVLFDIRLASNEERKKIVKTKYKESQAELFSICNLKAIRGENVSPIFDIRHELAINYLKQALIDEISPVRGKSAFEIGYSAKSKEILYNELQDQRIEWLKINAIKALAYCPVCNQVVEPVPLKREIIDLNQRVGCPHSNMHKNLQDLVFFMPDELDAFTRALLNIHS